MLKIGTLAQHTNTLNVRSFMALMFTQ